MKGKLSRRAFLKAMLAATTSLIAASCRSPFGYGTDSLFIGGDSMPMRNLGSTGEKVSLLGLGGQGEVDGSNASLAIDIINYAIDNGVNYIDTSYSYGTGASETYIGQVMATRRSEVFLATKSTSTNYNEVIKNFNTSLSRLQTDYVDLYQVHNIGKPENVTALFTPDANGRTAIDAFVRIRDEGKARFIGITGHHDPAQLLAVMNHPGAPNFDAILMAINPADWHTKPFQQELLPEAVSRKMAIIGMKVTGMNYLFQDIPNMADCLNYVYSLPISCAIVGIDTIAQLEQNIQITRDFSAPLSAAEMLALENMTSGTPISGSPRMGDWFKIIRY